jgi:isopentenyl-diphosphate Delta-isomerase
MVCRRYVTRQQLADMMHPDSGLTWSPWFRIIADRFLDLWWQELDAALSSDKFVDTVTVHRLESAKSPVLA